MKNLLVLLFSLLALGLHDCRPGPNTNSGSTNENRSFTVDEIRQRKPTFPGFTPIEYAIGFEEPTYIRMVTNSTRIQEGLMVYFDADAREWEQMPLGKGKGQNNNIVGDLKFERRYGFGKSYEDAPEFYLRYWEDGEQTWKNHKMEKAILNCDAKGKDPKLNWSAHLLVSLPLNPENNLPEVAIVLQWSKSRSWRGPALVHGINFKSLCSGLRNIPLEAR